MIDLQPGDLLIPFKSRQSILIVDTVKYEPLTAIGSWTSEKTVRIHGFWSESPAPSYRFFAPHSPVSSTLGIELVIREGIVIDSTVTLLTREALKETLKHKLIELASRAPRC